jgi:oligopeptide/dipeptide ABC transporter ATP-binding protein
MQSQDDAQFSDAGPSKVLEVSGLTTEFVGSTPPFRAVDDVTLDIAKGERIALVGESGSGKSMTARSILGLLPHQARIVRGSVRFNGRELVGLSTRQLASLRGSDIALIFQDPMTSWNPVKRVGAQISEAIMLHRRTKRRERWSWVVDLLRRVGIPSPETRARSYPHQFSGGMRQRGMIAMGLANDPALLIADEPTTALDVTVQDQIIRLLRDLCQRSGSALLLITHNLGLVASLCQRVVVMYSGQVVEAGTVAAIFKSPQHPYTWGLLRSIPRMDQPRNAPLVNIPGQPASGANVVGCRFAPRCAFKIARCTQEEPPLAAVGTGHLARCWVLMSNLAEVS